MRTPLSELPPQPAMVGDSSSSTAGWSWAGHGSSSLLGVLLLALAFMLTACAPRAVAPCQCQACPSCDQQIGPAACPSSQTNGDAVNPAQQEPSFAAVPDASGVARTEAELLARYEGRPAKKVLKGKATYYHASLAGNATASGEPYDPRMFTAAHKKLPFNTVVRVIRTDTNKYVYVRINDRGPYSKAERIIDLSTIAAERLGMMKIGVIPVRVEVLD